ncbi:MAG: class II aldolase/adducin family protein [Coriobacteriales bacterium]|jgi:L-fuculose-phosphate aldolase|nr:class II aldolase/adducin family protein [Coriobacteriales bacterium]
MADFDFEQFKKDMLDGVSSAADSIASAAKGAGDEVVRYKQFNETGRDLFLSAAVTSHGGNLSVSDGTTIWITKTGSMLGHLTPNDILPLAWAPSERDRDASIELPVHRAIYQALGREALAQGLPFGSKAIVHAHTPHTIFRSLIEDAIVPLDAEGILALGAAVSVLTPSQVIASQEAAELLAQSITEGTRIAILRGHGPFAVADTLAGAYRLISCLEQSAFLLNLFEQTGRKPG